MARRKDGLIERADGLYDSQGRKTNNLDGSVYYDENGYDAHGWRKPDANGGQTHRSNDGQYVKNFGTDYKQYSSKDLADYSNGHVYTQDYYNRDNHDRWKGIQTMTSTPDRYGARYNAWGISNFASDPNFVGIDDYWMSDYAPYGRNENGTPYNPDGSIMGYGGNGERYLQHLKERGRERIGYDPTGQSDKRDFESTKKPIYAPGYGIDGRWGGPGARGSSDSGSHSPGSKSHPSFDREGYDKASKDYNDYLSRNPDNGVPFPGGSISGSGSFTSGLPWDYNEDPRYNDLVQSVIDFNFEDWMKGDQYKQLEENYQQQGERAMQNALAEMAARTGGLGNSWAQTAAQQQQNDFLSKLNEVARSMYDSERSELIKKAQMAEEYEKYQYQQYLDMIANARQEQQWAYKQQQAESKGQSGKGNGNISAGAGNNIKIEETATKKPSKGTASGSTQQIPFYPNRGSSANEWSIGQASQPTQVPWINLPYMHQNYRGANDAIDNIERMVNEGGLSESAGEKLLQDIFKKLQK